MNGTRESAFTRTELLVVLGMLCFLAMLKVAAVSYTKEQGESSVCKSNLRRLQLAWTMYVLDNGEGFPGNRDGGDAQSWAYTNRTWAIGWLDSSGGVPAGANTNVQMLMASQLGKYSGTHEIYKCPSDTSAVRGADGKSVPRVRSISMNGYMGDRMWPYTAGYRQFKRMPELVDPPPSKAFVFIEEREDSINDGTFQIDMSGYDPKLLAALILVDYPGFLHNTGANLSFVDGHVEQWLWQDPRTAPVLRPGQLLPLGVSSPNNLDVRRLQSAASSKVR
jgi:prepilin-type processing-associated H-X9-DG protein